MKTAIGLMSGTSMDGIDLALIRTDGDQKIEFGPSFAVEYSPSVRAKIEAGLGDAQSIVARTDRPGDLAALESELTQLHVDAVNQMLETHNLSASEIDLLGFHGQTVLHRPEQGVTVQLGLGERLAQATGIDVVCDMRAADMVARGQGAPLVPVFHQALARQYGGALPVCFVNIGGISNITYVDENELIAFDSGPGNALIDQWVQSKSGQPYDAGGKLALEGEVVPEIVEEYLASDYFLKGRPKSLDRNDFPALNNADCSLEDGARTLAHVTAQSIVRAADHLPEFPKIWIICGGGRLNAAIMQELEVLATPQGSKIISADDIGLSGDMIEAQAFGYLAVRSHQGLPLTFPTTTGCRQPTAGGVYFKV